MNVRFIRVPKFSEGLSQNLCRFKDFSGMIKNGDEIVLDRRIAKKTLFEPGHIVVNVLTKCSSARNQ